MALFLFLFADKYLTVVEIVVVADKLHVSRKQLLFVV